MISGVRSLAAVLGADADLLEAAAWLHDIGYTANLANTGSRALDGAATCATPSFVEIAFAVGGTAAHHSLVGRREMQPGEAVHVTPKTVHRMTAITDCDIFEVSTPELHDVVRLEDRYGRQS